MSKQSEYLMPKQAAELLMVSSNTLRHWTQQGLLKAVITAGGHRRFKREEVERFLHERNANDIEKLKVLIVDDDPNFSQYLKDVLNTNPQVEATDIAHNGFDAGAKIHSFHPNVVLLDLIMPDLDGFAVCRQIKNAPETSSIRIIAMTGEHTDENVQEIISSGAETCLAKPFKSKVLFDAMKLTHKRD